MSQTKEIVNIEEVGKYIDEVFKPVSFEKKEECELCNLTKRTEWYYEDDKWIICKCKTCHRPMVVYKEHTMFIPIEDWVNIFQKVYELFGRKVVLRFKQRKIKNHFHIHIYREK